MKFKKCIKCKKQKFIRAKGMCKKCYLYDYWLKNKKKLTKKQKEYYKINKKYINKRNKKYNEENKIWLDKKQKEYSKNNKKKIRKKNKEYYKKNKRQLKEKILVYLNTKYKIDVNFKLSINLRGRLRSTLKSQKARKTNSVLELLGCSIEFLKKCLQNKFTRGMSWKNHGKWHIDHIKPLSKFDLIDPKQLKKACHYTNLQPLWELDNLRKSNK